MVVVIAVVVVLVVLLTAFVVPVEPYFAVGFVHCELGIVDVAVPLVVLVPVLDILSTLAVTHYAVTTARVTRIDVVNPVGVSVHPFDVSVNPLPVGAVADRPLIDYHYAFADTVNPVSPVGQLPVSVLPLTFSLLKLIPVMLLFEYPSSFPV